MLQAVHGNWRVAGGQVPTVSTPRDHHEAWFSWNEFTRKNLDVISDPERALEFIQALHGFQSSDEAVLRARDRSLAYWLAEVGRSKEALGALGKMWGELLPWSQEVLDTAVMEYSTLQRTNRHREATVPLLVAATLACRAGQRETALWALIALLDRFAGLERAGVMHDLMSAVAAEYGLVQEDSILVLENRLRELHRKATGGGGVSGTSPAR